MIHTYMIYILDCGLNGGDSCHTLHHRLLPSLPNTYFFDADSNTAFFTIQVRHGMKNANVADVIKIVSKIFDTTSDNLNIRIIKRN